MSSTKSLLLVALGTHLIVAVALAQPSERRGHSVTKVALCHGPRGKPTERHTIYVAMEAVAAHLAHGDSIGECPVGCRGDARLCNDDDLCTEDVCQPDGQCVHDPIRCDDNNECTEDDCAPSQGCTYFPTQQPDQACDDGNVCTTGDICVSGVCTGAAILGCCGADADCNDSDLCTSDACANRVCSHEAVTCTVDDQCEAAYCDPTMGCATTPVACDDSNMCTDDGCDPEAGCTHVPRQNPAEPVEVSCSDGIDNDCDSLIDAVDSDCVDTTPASLHISGSVEEGEVTSASYADFEFATDEPATICWRLDAGAATCSQENVTSFSSGTLSGLTSGAHVIEVTASDTAGNLTVGSRHWFVN